MGISIGIKEHKLLESIIQKYYTLIPDGGTLDDKTLLLEINEIAVTIEELSIEEEELLKSEYPIYFERNGDKVKIFHPDIMFITFI